MFNVIRAVSKFILFIAFLNIFAFAVYHVNIGGKKFGPLTEPIKSFSQFPKLAFGVIKEFTQPSYLIKANPEHETINKLDYDLYGLNAHFEDKQWKVELRNFKNDSLMYSWYLKGSSYNHTNKVFSHASPIAPILLENKNVVLNNHETKNLYRLDENSKIIWHNTEHQYHHSIGLDPDGDIWGCTMELIELNSKHRYWDNYITKIDVETGATILHKSISEILIENDLGYLVYGYANEVYDLGTDPLHHNEIEPVLEDGRFWKRGDLFLSFRHRSMVILYRPSTNKVLRLIQGRFINGHDVDIHSDSTITLFNNNISSLANTSIKNEKVNNENGLSDLFESLNNNAEVVEYNFVDSTFTSIHADHFKEHKIFTPTQGLHEFISNGDLFVENYIDGTIYVFDDDEVILKRFANEVVGGMVEPPHWVRIYESLDFSN